MTVPLLLPVLACGSPRPERAAPKPPAETQSTAPKVDEVAVQPAEVSFAKSASENFKRGDAALEAGDHVLAMKYFRHIQERFPYSAIAVRSELRAADTTLAAGYFKSAFDAYKRFAQFHPTHEMSENGYAQLMMAEAQARSLEEGGQMDPKERAESWRELETFYAAFVVQYAQSPHLPLAQKRLQDARARVAELGAGN